MRALARLFAIFVAVLVTSIASPARAARFEPPPLDGHVVDPGATLSVEQRTALDRKLEAVRESTGFAVVAFIVPSLGDFTIEDVAYDTFNTWKIGDEKADNGVLLVLAPNDHKSRIETGKGVGGDLTDLESSEILRTYVTPAMKAGDLPKAVSDGTDAIVRALAGDLPITPRPHAPAPEPAPFTSWLFLGIVAVLGLLAVVFPSFRWILFGLVQALLFRRASFGGGRGPGGGGGGGGYSGGGGSSGGGGASDGY